MATINNGWLVYHPDQKHLVPHAQDCAQHLGVTLEEAELHSFIANAPVYLAKTGHVVSLLESVDLGPLLKCVHEHGARVGLLPVHPKSKVCRLFRIPPTMEDAMPLALETEHGVRLELLLCNEEVVIWMVSLGDVPFIELRQIAYQEGLLWQHVKSIPAGIRSLFRLQPKEISVTTAKDIKIKTALAGAVVMENDIESFVPHFVSEPTSALDGMLYAVLVAPSSIMDYLSFLTTALSLRPRQPRAISYIKTTRLTLEGANEIDYYIDGEHRRAQHLEFRIIPKAVTVNVGQKFVETQQSSENIKDVIKIKTLPQGEERLKKLKKHLPLFSTAREEDFKEIFVTLRDYARLSAPFTLLMALSAMLATLGLFLNNAPVVIGAMLLAPLMGPLVSLAMGVLRNDEKLLKSALHVFAVGTSLTLLVAAMTTLLLPYEHATDEIRARLQPNLLDLGVAIISGIAAAYAHSRENIQKSLPGVAIAVALVPPACVMGIGIGWMDWGVISGAGLLFITNLVGIVLAGMLAFHILGFAPVIRVNRELGFSLLLAVLISIPLYHAFKNTVVYERTAKTISTQTYQINGKSVELSDVSVLPAGDKLKILAQLHSSEAIQGNDIIALRDIIEDQLEEPVVMDVSLRLVR